MSAPTPRGLLAVVRRLAAEPPPDSDADLVRRFAGGRDPAAFAALVRRHGPMVLAVCRRRLGAGPDADDAFQVAFMVLARDAGRIADPAAVAGWLYRVAHLSALKLRGKAARRAAGPLPAIEPADPAAPDPADRPEAAELRRAVEEEVAALPDKLRAVVALCGLEGRTNAEAARVLGCPTGTVDSRLSAARKRLRDRLARRGVLPAAGAALDGLLPSAAPADALIDRALTAAAAYAAAGPFPDPLVPLADGVTPLMGTVNLKLIAGGLLSAAVLATAGLGLVRAPADEKPPEPPPGAKAEPPKPTPVPKPAPGVEPAAVPPKDEAELRKVLAAPVEVGPVDGVTLRELLETVFARHGVTARIDTAAFKRVHAGADEANTDVLAYYEQPIKLPVTRGLSVGDLLTEAAAQLPGRCAVRLRGNQAVIVPAYIPPVTPGQNAAQPGETVPFISQNQMMEQIVGEPVSLAVDDLPLTEALKELRKRTGANIVLDARCKDKAKGVVSGAFSDVRLLTVLEVLADQCELRPVTMNNVYYLTTPENAARRQKEINRDLFGEPAPALGAPPGPPGGGPAATS